jgi:hypothetical protein
MMMNLPVRRQMALEAAAEAAAVLELAEEGEELLKPKVRDFLLTRKDGVGGSQPMLGEEGETSLGRGMGSDDRCWKHRLRQEVCLVRLYSSPFHLMLHLSCTAEVLRLLYPLPCGQ